MQKYVRCRIRWRHIGATLRFSCHGSPRSWLWRKCWMKWMTYCWKIWRNITQPFYCSEAREYDLQIFVRRHRVELAHKQDVVLRFGLGIGKVAHLKQTGNGFHHLSYFFPLYDNSLMHTRSVGIVILLGECLMETDGSEKPDGVYGEFSSLHFEPELFLRFRQQRQRMGVNFAACWRSVETVCRSPQN